MKHITFLRSKTLTAALNLLVVLMLFVSGISFVEAKTKSGSGKYHFDYFTATPSKVAVGENVRLEAEVSRDDKGLLGDHKPDFWFRGNVTKERDFDYARNHDRAKYVPGNNHAAYANKTYSDPGVYYPGVVVRWEDNDDDDEYELTQTTVLVVTGPPPTINFSADDGSIPYGHTTKLRWSTTNADKCWVPKGTKWLDGWIEKNGVYETPRLGKTAEFHLTCMGDGGTVTSKLTVEVQPAPLLPEISGGSYVKKHTGSSATINWAAVSTDWYEINLSYRSALTGEESTIALYEPEERTEQTTVLDSLFSRLFKKVKAQVAGWANIRKTWRDFPAIDTGSRRLQFVSLGTYTFTMTAQGVPAESVAVEVLPPPTCSVFEADPEEIGAGGASTLTWLCERYTIIDECTITPDIGEVEPDNGGAAETVTVSPRETTTYTLTCDGVDMLSPVTVLVKNPGIIEVTPNTGGGGDQDE